MAHSNNQEKFDSLLSKFVESNARWEEQEEKQMKQWLTEAEQCVRNRFRDDESE
jgi:hypothetical protein